MARPLGAVLLIGLVGCGGGGGGSGRGETFSDPPPAQPTGGGGSGGATNPPPAAPQDGGSGGETDPPPSEPSDGETDSPPEQPTGGGTDGGSGGNTDPPPPQPTVFSVPNPYALANANDVTDVRVDVTHIFGDSYSVSSRNGITNWPTFFRNQGTTNVLANNAVSGATAVGQDDGKTFDGQIDRFIAKERTIGDRDLTVVYMGYNDIDDFSDLGASKAAFTENADELRDLGATSGRRRMFVTLVHDWSRNPGQSDAAAKRGRVREWNTFLTGYANGRDNVVAVDLFTVFERIFADPERFGFTNVTTVDSPNSGSTALFDDRNHFGERGEKIIAEVYRYYLTRGWDWSNSLAAGSQASARLSSDIDRSLVFNHNALVAEAPLGLRAFPVGALPVADAAAGEDGVRVGFAEAYAGDRAQGGGVGLNYALGQGTALGLVISEYGATAGGEGRAAPSSASVDSDAISFYLDTDWGGLDLRTRVSYAHDAHLQRSYDALTGSGHRAEFDGTTWSVGQRLSYPVRAGGAWYTPWLDLSHLVQKVEGFTVGNPYVSDATYSPAEASDTLATLGFGLQLDPLAVGSEALLTLHGGVSYTHSLRRDDYEVEIREAALAGYTQKEVIARPEVERMGLMLGGDLRIGEVLAVHGGYAWQRDREAGASGHDLRLDLTYRF